MLDFEGPLDENLRQDLTGYLREFFRALNDPASAAEWVSELFPTGEPMRSLRDVEAAGAGVLAGRPVMRVERGASQVLFGMLPGQTADLEGRIWRVAHWVDPVPIPLDQDAVRAALLGCDRPMDARPGWTTGSSGSCGLAPRSRSLRLNMDRGVLVEPFPQQWRCKTCGTITR